MRKNVKMAVLRGKEWGDHGIVSKFYLINEWKMQCKISKIKIHEVSRGAKKKKLTRKQHENEARIWKWSQDCIVNSKLHFAIKKVSRCFICFAITLLCIRSSFSFEFHQLLDFFKIGKKYILSLSHGFARRRQFLGQDEDLGDFAAIAPVLARNRTVILNFTFGDLNPDSPMISLRHRKFFWSFVELAYLLDKDTNVFKICGCQRSWS